MSITTMLTLMVSSMLIYSAPLIFTSIGGVFSERGGVVNVGLEGIMVMGAFSGVVFNLEFAQDLGALTPWLALLVGGLVGAIFSLIHAVATVHFRADHVVSGTVLNLMAPALAVFLVKVLYNKGQTDNLTQTFGRFDFPVLANIPVIGDIFFKSTSLLGYLAIAFSFLAWFILFKTRFGLLAVIGHTFPIFAKFKGGKAVATSAGVIFGFAPLFCLYLAVIFFGILYLGSMISLSSISAAIAAIIGVLLFPLFGFILTSYDLLFTLIIIALASLVIVRHKDNIKRIQNKTENLIPWGLNITHQEPKK